MSKGLIKEREIYDRVFIYYDSPVRTFKKNKRPGEEEKGSSK